MEETETEIPQGKARDYPHRWAFYNNVALKESLMARGLSSQGNRKAWCARLTEYEDQVKEVHGHSTAKDAQEYPPRLMKIFLMTGYSLAACLKEVIIKPFNRQLLKVPGVTAWLDESTTYVFKKTKAGNSGAFLVFDTIDKGDAAYFDLKEKLQEHEVQVSHPEFKPRRVADLKVKDEHLETFMTEDFIKEDFLSRCIVLENVPEELNVDEKLCEIFPMAMSSVCYGHERNSKGMAIIELHSIDDVNKLMGDEPTLEVTIEGHNIHASKYKMRSNQWIQAIKLNKSEYKKMIGSEAVDADSDDEQMDTETSFGGKAPLKKVLSDNERLEMSRELAMIKEQICVTPNQTDLFGMEKLQRHSDLSVKMQEVYRPMLIDARRRFEEGLTLPEPWHLVPEPIQKIMTREGSAHYSSLQGLTEKYLKAKKEMDEAKKVAHKLVSSIMCVEKQLKDTEAMKWKATRATLEFEKVLDTKPVKKQDTRLLVNVPENNIPTDTAMEVEDDNTEVTSYPDTPTSWKPNKAQGKQKGGGWKKEKPGKGRGRGGITIGQGYGNKKNTQSDDYGTFGRRHEEIYGQPQTQKPTPNNDGADRDSVFGKNNKGKFGGNQNEAGFGKKGKGQFGGNEAQNSGGGKKRNNNKMGKKEEETELEFGGGDWSQFLGKMFGETTGGASGTVVTAEIPVKKRKGDDGRDNAVLETAQSQIKAGRDSRETNPPSSNVSGLMDSSIRPPPPNEAAKKWLDDYDRLKQDILTGGEPANKKPGKSKMADQSNKMPAVKWGNKKNEQNTDRGNVNESLAAGGGPVHMQEDTEEFDPSALGYGRGDKPSPYQNPRTRNHTGEGRENNRGRNRRGGMRGGKRDWSSDRLHDRSHDRSHERSHDRQDNRQYNEDDEYNNRIDRRDNGRNRGERGNDNYRGYRGDSRRGGSRRGREDWRSRDSSGGRHWEDDKRQGYGMDKQTDDVSQWTSPKEIPVHHDREPVAVPLPPGGAQAGESPALSKLSAIEAVLNEKMRKLQELQRNSRQTEMELLTTDGAAPADQGLGNMYG